MTLLIIEVDSKIAEGSKRLISALALAFLPLPPEIVMEGSELKLRPGFNILISFKEPVTSQLTRAPDPVSSVISINGGLITS